MATRNVIRIGEGKHRTKNDIERRQYEESLIDSTGEDLDHIDPALLVNDTAREEYQRVLMRLREEFGMVGNLNKSDLLAYANSYARYIDCVHECQKKTFKMVIPTKDGSVKANPLLRLMDEARRDMAESSRRLGMTIDGQLKAAKAKADKQEEEMEQKFGVI